MASSLASHTYTVEHKASNKINNKTKIQYGPKKESMNHTPVIIVGMARSGTTLVSHVLGSLSNVHIEVEPHALWKSGNFKYLNDEEYDLSPIIISNIRKKFTESLGNKIFVEKSPINCLRPHLVYAVFPEAKIVYIERDPVRCIYSNYSRSLKNDSFKLSIIVRKYFKYTGSSDLSGAISERKLFQQIKASDIPAFVSYTARMFYLRQIKKMLPFGPKLKDFVSIVKEKGLLAYHVDVYKRSLKYKEVYQELYGSNMQSFKMEEIMMSKEKTEELIKFSEIPYGKDILETIQQTFDQERIKDAVKTQNIDEQILTLIKNES